MSRSKGYWIKTLSKFVSVQLVVQALGFGSGILLVRTLSKEEYALFILANSMQGMMNVLADSGVSSALSSIGGKVWQDPYRFGQLINTAMQWRRYLAAIAVVIVTPILFWMLIQNGASVGYAIVIIAGVLIELDFYLRISVQSTVLRLNSQIDRIQWLDLLGAGSRVSLLGASFLFLSAGVGVLTSTITSGIQTLVLKRWIKSTINPDAPINKEDQRSIRKLVNSQLPSTIFFCLQGQSTIWLISIFGSTQNIAEVGALSRLSVLFTIIMSTMTSIVLPSFSRSQSFDLLVKRYWQILVACLIFSISLVLVSLFFSGELLWILGSQYANLKNEIILIMISSSVNSFAAILWSINSSRGWMNLAWLFPPVIIFSQIFLLFFLDISSVQGVILFNTFSIIPASFINFFMTYKGFKELAEI